MIEYVFGTMWWENQERETLKTVTKDSHTDLKGYNEITREYTDNKITDRFQIVTKFLSKEESGKFYDWYIIDRHYRFHDRSEYVELLSDSKIDYIAMKFGLDLEAESNLFEIDNNDQVNNSNEVNNEHSKHFYKVKKYYDKGLWSKTRVNEAVTSIPQWITEQEYEEITGEEYIPINE